MVERALNVLIDVAFYGVYLIGLWLLIHGAQDVGWHWLGWVFMFMLLFVLALAIWDMLMGIWYAVKALWAATRSASGLQKR